MRKLRLGIAYILTESRRKLRRFGKALVNEVLLLGIFDTSVLKKKKKVIPNEVVEKPENECIGN